MSELNEPSEAAELAPSATGEAAALRDRRLLARAVALNFASLAGKAFFPLLLALAPRWYGAEALGRFLLTYAITELLLALCSTGFVDGLYREIARLPGEPLGAAGQAAVRASLRAVLSLGVLVVAAAQLGGGALLAWGWGRPELGQVLAVAALSVPLAGATAVLLATSTATLHNHAEVLVKSLLVPAAVLAFAWWGRGAEHGALALARAYALAHALGLAAVSCWLASKGALGPLLWGKVAPTAWRRALRFGLLQGLSLMLWVSVYSVDLLVLGAFVGDRELARYRAGSELARVLQYVRTQLSAAYAPLAARYLRRGEHERLEAQLGVLAPWASRGALALAGALGYLASPVVAVMVPSVAGGTPAVAYVPTLLVGHWAVASLALAGNTLVVAGRQRILLLTTAAMALVNLGLGALLVPRLGLPGAALATAVAMLTVMGLQARALHSAVGVAMPWRALAPLPLLGAAALAGSAAVHWLAAPLGAWSRAAAAAASFVVVVLAYRPRRATHLAREST